MYAPEEVQSPVKIGIGRENCAAKTASKSLV